MEEQYNNQFEVFTYNGDKTLTGTKKFSSGHPIIDKFVVKGSLKQQASKSPGSGVKVLLDMDNEMKLAGFATLTVCTLQRQFLEGKIEDVGKKREIPAAKLVMLGVDNSYQGKGLGHKLLRVVFDSTKKMAEVLSCSGLFLESAPDSVDFYKKFNFIALDEPDPNTGIVPMFLHLNAIP